MRALATLALCIALVSAHVGDAIAQPAPATEPETNAQTVAVADAPPTPCEETLLADASYFKELRADAIAVGEVLCVKGGTRQDVRAAFLDFARKYRTQKWFERFGGFEDDAEPLKEVIDTVVQVDKAPAISRNAADKLSVDGTLFTPKNTETCRNEAKASCRMVLDEFAYYYTFAQKMVVAESAILFVQDVRGLRREWDEYLKSSRSQTPLELFINGGLFRAKETAQFERPPQKQWIVLHPSLVVENVDDAIDGEKAQEAVMLELVGVDLWKQDRWYVPTGGSIVRLYSDRAGTSSSGYGVALNFRHTYTIGVTDHDGDNGVFVSFDLLKLLQDKEKTLKGFIER